MCHCHWKFRLLCLYEQFLIESIIGLSWQNTIKICESLCIHEWWERKTINRRRVLFFVHISRRLCWIMYSLEIEFQYDETPDGVRPRFDQYTWLRRLEILIRAAIVFPPFIMVFVCVECCNLGILYSPMEWKTPVFTHFARVFTYFKHTMCCLCVEYSEKYE